MVLTGNSSSKSIFSKIDAKQGDGNGIAKKTVLKEVYIMVQFT